MKDGKPALINHPWRKAALGWRKTAGDKAVEDREQQERYMESRYLDQLDHLANSYGGRYE